MQSRDAGEAQRPGEEGRREGGKGINAQARAHRSGQRVASNGEIKTSEHCRLAAPFLSPPSRRIALNPHSLDAS